MTDFNEDAERIAFEEWAKSKGLDIQRFSDDYLYTETKGAWMGWLGRATAGVNACQPDCGKCRKDGMQIAPCECLRAQWRTAGVEVAPAGYKLVPVEPTPEMLHQGCERAHGWPTYDDVRRQWVAMLNAAPDGVRVDAPPQPTPYGLAGIEGDAIVIRLTADACAFAFANDPQAREPRPPVINKQQFLRDTLNELTAEREDGSTPLTDMLDRAMVRAMENGSDALDHDAVGVGIPLKEQQR